MASRPGIIRRTFSGLWWLLDAGRRLVLNLLFLALIVVVVAAWWSSRGKPALEEKTALVLALSGELVEQSVGGGRQALLAEALGTQPRETRLRDALIELRDTVDPADGYRAFRGRDPGIGALMRKRGFPAP